MATPIKRIEKDFFLKILYDEQIPIMYLRDRSEYILLLNRPAKNEIFLKPNRIINRLKIRSKIELMFDYMGQVIIFTIEVKSYTDGFIVADAPEFLYKNLDRSFSRIGVPPDLEVQFAFSGDRYNLSFPRITEYESGDIGDFIRNLNPQNFTVLIGQMAEWIKGYASDYKLVIFKDVKPVTIEERLIAETGKALFLASTQGTFPTTDPYPRRRLVTDDMFKRYLEGTGVDPVLLNAAAARFVKTKFDKGIFSDLWVPILFQEYVIGYIHTWINKEDMLPFNHTVIDTLYQFAKVLAYSLKINGFFNKGRLTNEPFEGSVIDISASGLFFTHSQSGLYSALLPDSEISVRLSTVKRIINVNAIIVRRFRDSSQSYCGCRFLNIVPEDMRFLFEFLYGKPFTKTDAAF
jgi:hypothetical protein